MRASSATVSTTSDRKRSGLLDLVACDLGRLAFEGFAGFAKVGIFDVRGRQGRGNAGTDGQSDGAEGQGLRLEQICQVASHVAKDIGRVRQRLCVFRGHAGRGFDTVAAGLTDRVCSGCEAVLCGVHRVLCRIRKAIQAGPLKDIAPT